MPFQQLYYTSCEHGLSGQPGYQFNAATPGVPVEVMREVERLTAYEPPAGLAYEPAGVDLDAYPVSLCYSRGETSTLARVVFAGADFSNRYGNYFAHALVSGRPEADLGGLLPIETWQAPFWAGEPVGETTLTALPGPLERGPMDRSHVQAFLDDHPEAGRLPALLTAAVRAVGEGDRSVVIVSPDAEDNACWIAAVSYLLPEALARRMSFTTYHRRPAHCPLHVVGTLPDRDAEWHGGAFHGFAVFDFAGGEFSAVEAHPVAELLARFGPVGGARLWQQAVLLGPGVSGGLDDWHGPIAAAAAVAGDRLASVDVDAAVGWFASLTAGRLDPPAASSVAQALLGHAAERDDHLRTLVAAARRLRATAQVDALETTLVSRELARVQAGGIPDASLAGWPALRQGVAGWLAGLVDEDPERAQQIYEQTAAGVLHKEDVADDPALRELELVRQARRAGGRPLEALATVVAMRPAATDPARLASLLRRLWPEGRWPARTAKDALTKLPAGVVATEVVAAWLADTVLDQPPLGDLPRWSTYLPLLELLVDHPVNALLAEPVREVVTWGVRFTEADWPSLPARAADVAGEMGRAYADLSQPGRRLLAAGLPALLLHAEGRRLPEVLVECPVEVVETYATRVRPALEGPQPDIALGADVFVAAQSLAASRHPHGPLLQGLLATTLGRWPRRDLDALQARLDLRGVDAVLAFARWRERQAPGGPLEQLGRFLRRDGPGGTR